MTWPEKYRLVWAPATTIPTVLALFNVCQMLLRHPGITFAKALICWSMILYIITRIVQLVLCLNGRYFSLRRVYWKWQRWFLVVVFLNAIGYAWALSFNQLEEGISIGIFVGWNFVLVIADRWMMGDDFRQLILHRAIIAGLGLIISADSVSSLPIHQNSWARVSGRIKSFFRHPSTGTIYLPDDDAPVVPGSTPSSPRPSRAIFTGRLGWFVGDHDSIL
ncbi:hypothetical protein B0H14DRAFT_3429357 [Mycena olivaceomarginata]|nr:hypothetical protein B0H14DRAFT_3429357 [Mycena olivaceomarginata]